MFKLYIWRHFFEIIFRSFYTFFGFVCLYLILFSYKKALLYIILLHLYWSNNAFVLIYTQPTEAFISLLYLTFWFSFFIYFPWCISQVYCFIIPGIFDSERLGFFFRIIVSFSFLFLTCFLGYCYLLPFFFKFVARFEIFIESTPCVLQIQLKIWDYLVFCLRILKIVFVISFFPAVLLIFERLFSVPFVVLISVRRFLWFLLFLARRCFESDFLTFVSLVSSFLILFEIIFASCCIFYFINRRDG